MKKILILLILLMVSFVSASDLIISGGTTTLCGNYSYDNIIVNSSATINICPYNGAVGPGQISLAATRNLFLAADSKIVGDYAGYRGSTGNTYSPGWGEYYGNMGEGDGAGQGGVAHNKDYGASGAGYGNTGGKGSWKDSNSQSGGISYGNAVDQSLLMGSGGGSGTRRSSNAPYAGGNGGASIQLKANNLTIAGQITTNGAGGSSMSNSAYNGGAGAGGSGGTIELEGKTINLNSSTFFAKGGNGGSYGYTSSTTSQCAGGGGAGGRIKIFYQDWLTNNLITTSVSGGSLGSSNSACSGGSGQGGGTGTINYAQMQLNFAPQLLAAVTIPTLIYPSSGNYFNLTFFDSANGTIDQVNQTIIMPNGTIVFANASCSWISGDASYGQNETWYCPTFNINASTSNIGQWNYTFSWSGLNGAASTSGNFNITDSVFPKIKINSPLSNSYIYANYSILLNFTASDDVELASCWYSLGTSNYSIQNCKTNQTIYFDYPAGIYNLTVWANDTSGNLNFSIATNVTIIYDNVAPALTIFGPKNVYCSKSNIPISFSIFDLGGASTCMYNVTYIANGQAVWTNVVLPGCQNSTMNLPAFSDYNFTILVNDTTGNYVVVSQIFTADNSNSACQSTSQSGVGGGGGVFSIIQNLINSTVTAKLCDQTQQPFDDAWRTFIKNKTWANFKVLWFAYWNTTLCKSSASIVPI